jgi:D-methionine transport system permease protein
MIDWTSLTENLGLLGKGTLDTLYMTLFSTMFSYILGLPLGIILVITEKKHIRPNSKFNSVLGSIVNFLRSVPFIILLIAVIPLTRLIAGTTIGATASVVPLVIAATPFVARMVESSLKELDRGLIEAAQSMGASTWQIISKVMVPETLPSLILGFSITTITLIGYSAMAGTVGGGGLGDIAIRYGYYRYEKDLMFITIILLIIIVQLIQSVGNFLSYKIDKRNK